MVYFLKSGWLTLPVVVTGTDFYVQLLPVWIILNR